MVAFFRATKRRENSAALANFLELQEKEIETSNMSNNMRMRMEVHWKELKALGACFRSTAALIWLPRALYSARCSTLAERR